MKTRIALFVFALFLSLSVTAQPPRIKEEARRMTNSVDRRVGLTRGQYDRIYGINLRFARREIGPEGRDRAYRRVLSDRQWDIYMGRHHGPRPGYDRRPAPGPRYDSPRRGYDRRPADRRRDYDRRRY